MRILLALVTLFAVFHAQAYCYLTDNVKQPQIDAKAIELNLDTVSSSNEINLDMQDEKALSFACLDENGATPNQFVLSVAQNTNEYYMIENGSHKLFVRIWLEPGSHSITDIFSRNYFKAYTLNTLNYKLKYTVQSNFTGDTFKNADINGIIKMDNHLIIKPIDCSLNGDCKDGLSNTTHQYTYNIYIKPKFTPTTCTFSDQEISAPEISYQDINTNDFAAPTTAQPELLCSSTTGVATSNIHYHFEAISLTTGKVLQNELETQPGSAGQVGFILRNNNQDITSYPSQKFTMARLGNPVQNGSTFPLNLQLRYASYGNKVFSGLVQSKVKVVVDYD